MLNYINIRSQKVSVNLNKQFLAIGIVAAIFAVALLSPPQTKQETGSEISFETIAKGEHSAYTDATQMVINQQFVFSDLWKKMHAIYSEIPNEPQIDFSSSTAIAVFMGQKNTGGYSIEIVKILDAGDNVVVYVKETKPWPGSIVTQALTQPYHIVKTEKLTKPVVFEKAE